MSQSFTGGLPIPTGGVNFSDDIFTINQNQLYRAVNFHMSENGVFYSRRGSRLLNATALAGAVTSIYDYWRPSGTTSIRTVLVTAYKTLYKYNESTGTFDVLATLESSDRPCWETYTITNGGSVAFMCNGTDFKYYDGNVVQDVTFVTDVSNPRTIIAYDDRMLAAGCDNDPFAVYQSQTLDGTVWEYTDNDRQSHYWPMEAAGNRVTALKKVYNYGVVFQRNSVSILTGADVEDTTTEKITVSREYGTTSQWSVQTVGNTIYFADEKHIYRGVLRSAIDNGLEVVPIDGNISRKYKTVRSVDDMVSVYDGKNDEIQWGIDCKVGGRKDTSLVYSVSNSGDSDGGYRDVWSGWFEGSAYEPYTLAAVLDSDRKPTIWRGDEDGYVYVMDEDRQYKDDTTGTAADISFEIITAPSTPQGLSVDKHLEAVTPLISQFYDESVLAQWILDGSRILPITGVTYKLKNNIPFWNEGSDTNVSTLWGSTVWTNNAYIIRPIRMHEPFRYVQFRFTCNGSNARDAVRYSGIELVYKMVTLNTYRQG